MDSTAITLRYHLTHPQVVSECLESSQGSTSALSQLPANAPGTQQTMTKAFEFLPLKWENWMEFLIAALGLVQFQLLWAYGE